MKTHTYGMTLYVAVSVAILAGTALTGTEATPLLLMWTGANLVSRTYAR